MHAAKANDESTTNHPHFRNRVAECVALSLSVLCVSREDISKCCSAGRRSTPARSRHMYSITSLISARIHTLSLSSCPRGVLVFPRRCVAVG